jgi:hypothetical protein
VLSQPGSAGSPLNRSTAIAALSSAADSVSSGPYHIATYAYDNRYGQGSGVSASVINQLLSYAQGDDKALNDCHSGAHQCKAVYYLRPFAEVATSPSSCREEPDANVLNAASEDWFLHLPGYHDAAHRVKGKDAWGCVMYAMNPNKSAMQIWWRNYLRNNANNYDLFFVDEEPMDMVDATSFHSGGGCNGEYCLATEEIGADPAMKLAHINFVNMLNYGNGTAMHFIWQQAYPPRTKLLDLSAMLLTNRYDGVSCEGCIVNTNAIIVPSNYEPFLDEMAEVIAENRSFLIIADGDASPGSSTEILQRLVTIGIVWLAYSEGHIILQPNLERYTNRLAVWPEDLIYPTQPLQSMVSGASDLQVAPGVWRREFVNCYQKGRSFGHCAAIVNSTRSPVTVKSSWLRQGYRYVITLSGGDYLSGGTANVTGSLLRLGTTTIQAGGAILLGQ